MPFTVKPANIKITLEGAVKVSDFGLAKALDPADSSRQFQPERLSHAEYGRHASRSDSGDGRFRGAKLGPYEIQALLSAIETSHISTGIEARFGTFLTM